MSTTQQWNKRNAKSMVDLYTEESNETPRWRFLKRYRLRKVIKAWEYVGRNSK